MPIVPIAEIEQRAAAALIAHGAPIPTATEMARAMASAEARGNRICGLYYLESYCQQLRTGRVDGAAIAQIERPRPGVVRVDARNGFAQMAFASALPVGLAAARACGTATLAIGHSHTCTALGYFTEQIARAGLIALGFTNATPIVAAPGGKGRVIGTNPIAFAVPDGAGGVAMAFDQSTSAVALGRITMAKAAGQAIPEGWAVDAAGLPTTDPAVALGGSLMSSGGYKGWGIGLMVELLAAGLGGGALSRDVQPLKAPDGAPHDLSQTFILIDPAIAPEFPDRLSHLIETVEAEDGARLPGRRRKPLDAVELSDDLVAQLAVLERG